MIKKITHAEALNFFLEHHGWIEHVTFTEKGEWFGFFNKETIQGIVSTQQIGKWLRVKTLFVAKKNRGKGIGLKLVKHVSKEKDCTAFAFNSSKRIFEQSGFKVEKQNKNGVWFMRKEF